MAQYLILIIGGCIIACSVCAISPKGAKRYIRLICSLCLLCVIAAPLSSIDAEDIFADIGIYSESVESGGIYDEIYANTIRAVNEERISSALKDMLVKDLSLDAQELCVSAVTVEEGGIISVSGVSVGLSGKNILIDPSEIILYVEEMLGCECEIIYY